MLGSLGSQTGKGGPGFPFLGKARAEALHPVPAPPSLAHLLWSAVMEGSGLPLFPDVALRVKECRLCLQQCVEGPCRESQSGEGPPKPNPAPNGEEERKASLQAGGLLV